MGSKSHLSYLIGILLLVFGQVVNCSQYGAAGHDNVKDMDSVLQWSTVNFNFPCASTKSLFKSSGKFISKNIIATRAQLVGDTVYMAMPRYRNGVAATLVTTNLTTGVCATVFKPFPCWDMQEEGNCKAFQSVVDLVVDQNDILWVLDTGVVDTLETPLRKCQPKVVALSTKTGKVLKVLSLEGLASANSRLQYLLVDYSSDGSCFVYVSDAANRVIIVYNLLVDRGFRVVLPKAVVGANKAKDVLYIALIRRDYANTELYFSYLSASRLFALRTEYLRNGMADGRITDLGRKPSPMVIIGTDNGSALFFRNEGGSDVFRYDTNTTFQESNFRPVYRSPSCQLATHAITDYQHNTMRVLQSSFPDFMLNRVGCGATQQLAVMQGCW